MIVILYDDNDDDSGNTGDGKDKNIVMDIGDDGDDNYGDGDQ